MDAKAGPGKLPIRALLRRRVKYARIPNQRNGDRPAVDQANFQFIVANFHFNDFLTWIHHFIHTIHFHIATKLAYMARPIAWLFSG